MKKLTASALLSIFFPAFLLAQPLANSVTGFKTGVYFTLEEFTQNRPAESPQDCSRSNCYQVFNDFGMFNLKVKTEQSSNNIYPAGTIFAFVDCYGRSYRYFEGQYYQILDMGAINIFVSIKSLVAENLFIPESEYFFSTSLEGDLQPLQRALVINSYQHYPEFATLVDKTFYPNVSLKQFNSSSGVYELNRAYNQLTALVSQR
jgi:hypothetical protein